MDHKTRTYPVLGSPRHVSLSVSWSTHIHVHGTRTTSLWLQRLHLRLNLSSDYSDLLIQTPPSLFRLLHQDDTRHIWLLSGDDTSRSNNPSSPRRLPFPITTTYSRRPIARLIALYYTVTPSRSSCRGAVIIAGSTLNASRPLPISHRQPPVSSDSWAPISSMVQLSFDT
ncbi:hypothetical protein SODALDRAFT_360954 [Sodiomyces alkalinus F11]|uniref:Uncharacterized protein n=1 Tax=Sodiomyces alkalinus (strain CBS 110278 / VKM F-3762 / F11) TaxID=1314773 RepID=A0A3N2PRW6_SODAK|nr:hypothetical protein SODALDRAFT_360954 [Sodiomyces alkalinus F11]ROT37259.1 hypothetical protein SODALDRAFT_360954 [Sodiomyces alkalinus F11]